jgi:hypothetical protein
MAHLNDIRTTGTAAQPVWTWSKIREYMADKYGHSYTVHDLRAMEIKWRRIFADAGWRVKGQ